MIEDALKWEKVGENLYQEYSVGDTVRLLFSKETNNANINLLGRESDKIKDCTVTGVIKEKWLQSREGDKTIPLPPMQYYFLEIEIVNLCSDLEEAIYGSLVPLKKGEIFTYHSSCCEIEKNTKRLPTTE